MAVSQFVIAGAVPLIKLIMDDIYGLTKTSVINKWANSRSDIKDAQIARSISSVVKVKTLWNLDKEVSLYDFYFPSKIVYGKSVSKEVNFLNDFCENGFNYVLQGTAGQGKSTFLRYLCGQELKNSDGNSRIPIFIELRRMRSDYTLNEMILDALKKYKLPSTVDAWDSLARTGKFILLLDAFDEIDPALCGKAICDIEHMSDVYSDALQIVVTARPEADIQKSAKFRIYKLAPLRGADHPAFFRKICADKGEAENIASAVSNSSTEIKGLLTTPLMATLLVLLYKSIQTIPDTLPRFYEELFDVLFYRHDNSKPGFKRKRYTNLDDSKIKKIFSAFCFYYRIGRGGVLSDDEFKEYVNKSCKACGEVVAPEKFRDEIVKTVCLMQQEGLEYSFIHRSVVQYYSASFVKNSSDEFSEKFYNMILKSEFIESWELELRFLSQIDSYRYSLKYEIPYLNEICSYVGFDYKNNILCKSFLDLTIDSCHVRIGVGKNKKPQGRFSNINGWGYKLSQNPIENRVVRLALGFFVEAIDKIVDDKFWTHAANKSREEIDGYLVVDIKNIEDNVRNIFNNFDNDIKDKIVDRLKNAERIIKIEKDKVDALAILF